jgi:hypothetical protein
MSELLVQVSHSTCVRWQELEVTSIALLCLAQQLAHDRRFQATSAATGEEASQVGQQKRSNVLLAKQDVLGGYVSCSTMHDFPRTMSAASALSTN